MRAKWSVLVFASFALGFNVSTPNKVDIDPSLVDALIGEGIPQEYWDDYTTFGPRTAVGPRGEAIDHTKMTVSCNGAVSGHACSQAIDADAATYWQTKAVGQAHTITVRLDQPYAISGIRVQPATDPAAGWITGHNVQLSADGQTWSAPVAYGRWRLDNTDKYSSFEPQLAQYVKLTSNPIAGQASSIATLDVYRALTVTPPNPARGRWGPTIDFPIVPVAAGLNVITGAVITWSSWSNDHFFPAERAITVTSTLDLATQQVSVKVVNTDHDMFCPGISMGTNGQIIVTGGNTSPRTSIYQPGDDTWRKGHDMIIPRGYQSTVTLSDGRVFIIGGSWSGGDAILKNGELYTPATNTYVSLPRAVVAPMLTHDSQDFDANGKRISYYRGDNHGWFFAWKGNSVFQAGPSRAMNWYSTSSGGSQTAAGNRCDNTNGVRCDAMSGNAVMYNAVDGKVVTFGGAPDYTHAWATKNAFQITLRAPNSPPAVIPAGNGLHYPRTFHSSVVLPDGTVFITGGQAYGINFNDDTAQMTPERYFPGTNTFSDQQPNSIIRTYHSWSLLLPDATVLNGGGGLCGPSPDCPNHFDAQIYTPGYLLNVDGSLALRPRITSAAGNRRNGYNKVVVLLGNRLSFTTDSPVTHAALVRYGTATHTVNTDQRRIPLVLQSSPDGLVHTATIPSDPGVAVPGYWMLFALNASGRPSRAETIQITHT